MATSPWSDSAPGRPRLPLGHHRVDLGQPPRLLLLKGMLSGLLLHKKPPKPPLCPEMPKGTPPGSLPPSGAPPELPLLQESLSGTLLEPCPPSRIVLHFPLPSKPLQRPSGPLHRKMDPMLHHLHVPKTSLPTEPAGRTTPGLPAYHRMPLGPLLPKETRLHPPAADGNIFVAPAPNETTPGPPPKAAPPKTIRDHHLPAVPLRGVVPGTHLPTAPTKTFLGLPFPSGQPRVTVPEPPLHLAPNQTRCLGHPFPSGQPKGTGLRPRLLPS